MPRPLEEPAPSSVRQSSLFFFNENSFSYHVKLKLYNNANCLFSGQVTDFHAWDRHLEFEEMVDWTNCENGRISGNLVEWDPDVFEVENMTMSEVTMDEGSLKI